MPSMNQEIPRQIESLSPPSPNDVLSSILQSKDPTRELEKSTKNIPFFLSTEHSTELKNKLLIPEAREEAMTELVYYCLPQLNTVLREHQNLGIDQEELFSFCVQSLITCIAEWDPKKITEDSPTNGELRQTVLKKGRRLVQEFITKQYGLSLSRFDLFPIYFQVRQELQEDQNKNVRLSDWHSIRDVIEKYASMMPAEEKEKFQTMRFIKNSLLSEQIANDGIDALELIHKHYCSEAIQGTIEDLEMDLDDSINRDSLKEAFLNALEDLPPRIKEIVELYYGISDGQSRTLEEVAIQLGCSHQNVHQLLAKGIRMLRHPLRSKYTKQFLDS